MSAIDKLKKKYNLGIDSKDEDLAVKLLEELEKFGRDRKIYNWVSIVLSILDVACGIFCLIYASMLVASVVVSSITGLVIATKTIQGIKAQRLVTTLNGFINKPWARRVFSLSLCFVTARIKRGNSKMGKWIKANKFSIILGILACGVIAAAVWFIIESYWLTAPLWASITITSCSGLISLISVYFLGHEKVMDFANRILLKKLSPEQSKKITEYSEKIIEETKLAEEKEKAELIAKREALAEAEAELKAKQKAELDKLAELKLAEKKSKLEG